MSHVRLYGKTEGSFAAQIVPNDHLQCHAVCAYVWGNEENFCGAKRSQGSFTVSCRLCVCVGKWSELLLRKSFISRTYSYSIVRHLFQRREKVEFMLRF